jgi:hypothetical protein
MRSALPLALLFMASALAVGADAGAATRCDGGKTVRATSRYRISIDHGIYEACLRSIGKPTELYEYDSDLAFGRFVVSGRYIAVVAASAASDGDEAWLVLADMRTARSRIVSDDEASRLALRATGSLAFSVAGDAANPNRIELARFRRRRSRTLAATSALDPLSLRRRGRRAEWKEKGQKRSVLLP